jgi:hypothetical protein
MSEFNWDTMKESEYRNCETCGRRFLSMDVKKCPTCRGVIYNPYHLNQFIKSYYISPANDKYCNYISQTGGRYNYPNDMDKKFATELAKCWMNSQPFSMIENVHKTTPFKLFFDIEDDNNVLPPSKEIVKEITKHIKTLTSQKDLKFSYISLVNNKKWKHRRHIIFPKISLNLQQYKTLLEGLPEYVDKSVHGLRLIYSSKVKKLKSPEEGKYFDTSAGIYIPEALANTKKEPTIEEITNHFMVTSLFNIDDCERLKIDVKITKQIKSNGVKSGEKIQPIITTKLQEAILTIFNKKPVLYENFNLSFQPNGYMLLKRIKPSECPLCLRVHDSIDCYVIIQNEQLRFKCFNYGTSDSVLVAKIPKRAFYGS